MATIWPNFEEAATKLVYNPKLYMLLGVYGKKYKKNLFNAQKEVYDKCAFPPIKVSWLRRQYMHG